MRTLVVFLAGIVVGAAIFWAGATAGSSWYEYRILTDERLDVAINRDGWEPVTGQPDRFLVRRPRLRLP